MIEASAAGLYMVWSRYKTTSLLQPIIDLFVGIMPKNHGGNSQACLSRLLPSLEVRLQESRLSCGRTGTRACWARYT